MDIYVVQQGDTINSVADKYGVDVTKLIQDNGIENPNDLVIGQTIVITYPIQTYTVQEGDTLTGIAASNNVPLMQLLRNNPGLCNQEYLYPGETINISYNTKGKIITNGFTYPYIKKEILLQALPNLTYLSIFNYRSTAEGEIVAYFDDTELINMAKSFGVIPLMMTTTLTPQGQPNIQAAFSILQNVEYQNRYIDNLLAILKEKGFYGINIIFNFMTSETQVLYDDFLKLVLSRLSPEGYLLFATINYSITMVNNEASFEQIDFSTLSQSVNKIIFLQLTWGTNSGPPSPVISIENIRKYLDYLITLIPNDKIILGTSLISYDWALPHIPGKTHAHSLTLNSSLKLANEFNSSILFDTPSQTPYFNYSEFSYVVPIEHIVWSLDARTINALTDTFFEYELSGIGLWNIMVYYPQIWLIINSQYEIQKLIPDSLT